MAPTVLLALDADSAGQEAMLRAAAVAARRKLDLRVVPLPPGTDPAELVQREGAAAIERAIEASAPFVRFRVGRVLDAGHHASAEGRDRMLDELRPVFATIPPSALRMELTRMVSERLDLPESLTERALAVRFDRAGAGPRAGRHARSGAAPSGAGESARGEPLPSGSGEADRRPESAQVSLGARGERTERAFLALCIADPTAGAQALAELDAAELFTTEVLRGVVAHLREHLADPGAGLPEDDPALVALVAEIVVEAGRQPPAPAMLASQRMQLELARIDREIVRARGRESGEVSELAHRRAEVKREFDRAYERALEETGAGTG
jgi:DNA primase